MGSSFNGIGNTESGVFSCTYNSVDGGQLVIAIVSSPLSQPITVESSLFDDKPTVTAVSGIGDAAEFVTGTLDGEAASALIVKEGDYQLSFTAGAPTLAQLLTLAKAMISTDFSAASTTGTGGQPETNSASVGAGSVPSADSDTSGVTELMDQALNALSHANYQQYCSLLANSRYDTNPAQAPDQPYSAADRQECEADSTPASGTKGGVNMHVSRVLMQGNEALVNVSVCVAGNPCQGTEDPDWGMPGPTTGKFSSIFKDSAQTGSESNASNAVFACEKINRHWFIVDDSSDN